MKQIKRIMIVVLALVLAVSLSLTAFAATASQDGLELSVTTDKTSYTATEQVTVTITVKNTNAFAVSNVAVESNVPDGYKPADGYSSTKNIATLGAGETATLTVVYVPQNSGQPSSPSYPTYPPYPWYSGNTSNTSDAEETEEVVEIDQPTEGNTNVFEEVTVTAKRNVGLWVLIAVVSAGALIAVLAGKKRLKKTMSIMLCIAMVGTLAAVLPVEVNAAVMPIEAGGVKSLSAETEISVAGKNVNVSASVQYVLDSENPNPITYTVTFEANGENVENLPETQKVKEGECAIEPIAPSREGFDFTGWYTDEKAETPFDFSSKITSDIVLYAGWKEIVKPDVYYTVTFDANGENVENLPKPQKVKEGECAVEPIAPSRESFDFTGWYTDEAAETPFDFSSKITNDIVLYAGWKEIVKPNVYYTVTFEANGENVKNLPELQKVKEGECAVEPVIPSREGYIFVGWKISTSNAIYDFNAGVFEDIVLVAIWYVDYENGDSLYEISNDNVKYDKTENVFYTENIVIAFIKNGLSNSQKQNIVDSVGGILVGELSGDINILQIQVQSESLSYLSSICSQLSLNSDVYYATCDYPIPSQEISDNSSANTGNITEGNWWYELIGAKEASELSQKYFTAPKIGVIDSGIDDEHPELSGKISFASLDFQRRNYLVSLSDGTNHGTHVTGIIAASDDDEGMTGVIPNCEIVFGLFGGKIKSEWNTSLSELHALNCEIEKGCRVVNCSFGIPYYDEQYFENEKQKEINSNIPIDERQYNFDSFDDYTENRWNARKRRVEMVTAATCELISTEKPFLIIQGAGNDGVDARATSYWAGVTPEISEPICQSYNLSFSDLEQHFMVVGGITQEHNNNHYRLNTNYNYGETVDICAPSVDIVSSVNNVDGDIYAYGSGTSQAAPIVSGTAALIWAINPELSSKDVQKILKESTRYSAEATINGKLYQYPVVDTLSSTKAALKLVYGDVYERGTNNLIYDAKATLTGLTEDKQTIEVSEYAHAGSFEIRIPNDMVSDIKLTVSCDGYEDYVYPLGISPNTSTDVGDIYLEHTPIKFNTALSGIVIDSDQSIRLEGVEVSVYDETDTNLMYAQTTDEYGYFYIGIEAAGNYVVHFDKEGYDTIRKEIYVIDSLDNSMGFISLNDGSSYNFSGGDGTKDNPYLIETAEQLNAVRNDMSANYVLSADIDLSNYGSWDPIGTVNKRFTGFLDGNNHKIIGLTINNDSVYKWATDNNGPADQYTVPVGLFGILGSKASVRNIVFENYTVSVGNTGYVIYSGAVAGYLYINSSNITISNCIVNGTITLNTGDDFGSDVGGIVGAGVWCTATISNCINNAPIDVSGYGSTCGGIAGYMNNATIELCVNNADVQGLSEGSFSTSGGIIGNGTFSTVSKCDNFGNISTRAKSYTVYTDSENSVAGGIAGSIERTIDSCNNYGDVYAEHDVVPSAAGGICGEQLHNSDGYISNCTNYGKNIKAVYRSWIDKDKGLWEYKYGYAARICGYAKYFNEGLLRDNKSISTTIVNGAIPTEHIGPNEINGESIE